MTKSSQPSVTDPSPVPAGPNWEALLRSFYQFAHVQPASHLLDVGGGPGLLARDLARVGHTVTGIDTDPFMIDHAQELAADLTGGNLPFEVGQVQHLRFEQASFDAAFATNIIFLLPDPITGSKGMTRVVRPGGVVAMLTPPPKMTLMSAESFAREERLEGSARTSPSNWAQVAIANHRFSPDPVRSLLLKVGLGEVTWAGRLGIGLALLVRGVKQ